MKKFVNYSQKSIILIINAAVVDRTRTVVSVVLTAYHHKSPSDS